MTGTAPDAGHVRPNVFNVPPGVPFLDALAAAILSGDLPAPGGAPPDPLDLARYTILLPTRRAVRALGEAFLAGSKRQALLLPQIRAIRESDEDASLLSALVRSDAARAIDAALPPAVGTMERLLVLTQLVEHWARTSARAAADESAGPADSLSAVVYGEVTAAQALGLARELARLMDMVETEGVSLDRLAGIVPEALSEHWQRTLDFLRIVTSWWPQHLASAGRISPAEREALVLAAETERLANAPADGPLIVAGVTGSVPAAARLIGAIARRPHAAIVLPGLDLALDDDSFAAIVPDHPEHPQFGLACLLATLGIGRGDVRALPGPSPAARLVARERLVANALRPAATTERWHVLATGGERAAMEQALEGLSLIEASGADEEAEVIALILREALETPGRTAALVTPDRVLARRVTARLERWGIRVDDSAGRPFAKTVPGTFLELVLGAVASDFAPVETMALLKHPLTRLGRGAFEVRRAARALEIAAFRTPYLGRGIGGVERALEQAAAAVQSGQRRDGAAARLWDEDWAGARGLVESLRQAATPLCDLALTPGRVALSRIVARHADAAVAIARLPEGEAAGDAAEPLWQGEAGEAASRLLASMMDPELPALDIGFGDYSDFYRQLVGDELVRPRVPVHPRLSIWGPFEARLQRPDIIVLGSLNEGTWPEAMDPGPWLNRPMRQMLGLPQPEVEIGRAAHDFSTLLGAERVYLTRAKKVDGVPMVASRWLLRLATVLQGLELSGRLAPAMPWLGWARMRDRVDRLAPVPPPRPCPPVELRPRRLSVSDVEAWIANPYAIHARRILRLEAMAPLGARPGAGERGSVIHAALGRFAARHPHGLPFDVSATLMEMIREELSELAADPRIAAFWVQRFERFAGWFAETEPARREGVEATLAEVSGSLVIEAPAGPFTLTARADRIDVHPAGLIIADYKSGANLDKLAGRARQGEAPQLLLEAAIALAGGFAGLPAARIAALRYISASGGEPAGSQRDLDAEDPAALGAGALRRLERLIAEFDDAATPYAALRRARFTYDYDAYAHLARVGEWPAGDDGEAED